MTVLATVVVVWALLAIYGVYLGVASIKASSDESECIESEIDSTVNRIAFGMDTGNIDIPPHVLSMSDAERRGAMLDTYNTTDKGMQLTLFPKCRKQVNTLFLRTECKHTLLGA